MDYKAVVCKIKVSKHPNADRLQVGACLGYKVIVGLEVKDGDKGIFFNTGGALSEQFANAHDLVERKDESRKKINSGYFCSKRRVRAMSLRGIKSDGFWCPVSFLDFTGVDTSKLEEGFEFDNIKGISICNKYVTPATQRSGPKNQQKRLRAKVTHITFPKHFDTQHLRRNIGLIKVGDRVTFTEKCHGTSQRVGNVLCHKSKPLVQIWNRLVSRLHLGRLKLAPYSEFWKPTIGTRNTVLVKPLEGDSFYTDTTFRADLSRPFINYLKPGELVFAEIVGYSHNNKTIMSSHYTDKLSDKNIKKKYGSTINYTYGCVPGQAKLFVYRIAESTYSGETVDLSWEKVKERCLELGLNHVPEVHEPIIFDGNVEKFMEFVDGLSQGPSTLDMTHIREGVCVRIDRYPTPIVLKHKSHLFGVLEGYAMDNDDFVDAEEAL